MRKKYIYTVFLFTLFFCKKEEPKEKKNINSQAFFSKIADISKFEKSERTKLNDSTYRIKGDVGPLHVTGYLTQNNEKIDWWKIVDSNSDKELMIIEYRLVDNKEFANQYKIFNNSELDIYKSKYYALTPKKSNVFYSFYVPKNKDIIKTKGKFLYSVYDTKKNEEIGSSECECINSDNQFRCTFSIPNKNNIVISGVFFELSQTKDGKMGGSEIYVRDTLK
ncbi:hypothetical protein MKS83_17440 [Chryseobacterium sp. Y16C]|uniref:hypothetical protein n=1 Tax=Chryseobacterium sp. Y16C TaxID=2920939 RepID=UPI001F0B71A4|nr:hypothetical protein [Chryseobacterium sp. Y16C]UMQ41173.1 hypothetical protein MKS83_17440 [Chryseobacterium sp. Y16C]